MKEYIALKHWEALAESGLLHVLGACAVLNCSAGFREELPCLVPKLPLTVLLHGGGDAPCCRQSASCWRQTLPLLGSYGKNERKERLQLGGGTWPGSSLLSSQMVLLVLWVKHGRYVKQTVSAFIDVLLPLASSSAGCVSALFCSREEPQPLAVRPDRLGGTDKPGGPCGLFVSEFYIPALRVVAFTAKMGRC